MTSPPPAGDAPEASSSSTVPRQDARPIHSFFSKPTATPTEAPKTGQPSQSSAPAVPKRKRKPVDGPTQSKLGFRAKGEQGGDVWVIEKPTKEEEVKEIPAGKDNATGQASGNGEGKKKNVGKGKRKADAATVGEDDGGHVEISQPEGSSPDPPTGTTALSKKKRPRPSQPPNASSSTATSLPSRAAASSSSSIATVIIDDDDDDIEITSSFIAPSSAPSRPAPKPAAKPHPFFGRASARGTEPEGAIEVPDTTPSPVKRLPGPKKILFASDPSKPTHSFFNRVRVVESDSASGEGGGSSNSAEATPSTPVAGGEDGAGSTSKSAGVEKKPSGGHSFFQKGGQARELGKLKDGWGKAEKLAPLPGGSWPTHVDVCPTASTGAGKGGRKVDLGPSVPRDSSFWNVVLGGATPVPPSPVPLPAPIAVPPHLHQHPAFSSISAKAAASTVNRDSWTDRYRPLRASEVLGNELEATYLRDWLSTLAVGHHADKSLKVFRKVSRKARSGLVDGFIVDDLGVYGDAMDKDDMSDEEEELEDLPEPDVWENPEHRPHEYPTFKERLTNTVLLTGPHGSGKNAAVYAAAHELGWDVFEVNPGVGKRTGGNLMGWVGDVGKNHSVINGGKEDVTKGKGKKEKEKEKEKAAAPVLGGIKSFFGKGQPAKKKPSTPNGSQGSAATPIDIDSDDDPVEIIDADHDEPVAVEKAAADVGDVSESVEAVGNGDSSKVRQSLILIDEADILFEEEASFWPAVISLISESRRPVILTCNNLQRIPRHQLPLQAILHFHPPPCHTALPYLQSIATCEEARTRTLTSPLDIAAVHTQSTHQLEEHGVLGDQPVAPNGNERLPYFDLRRAITQLQLGQSSPNQTGRSIREPGESDEVKALCERIEMASFADAHVDTRLWVAMEIFDVDRPQPSVDDEFDVSLLVKPGLPPSYPIQAVSDKSSEISATLVELAGGSLPSAGDLDVARTLYTRSTLPILDPLIPLSAPLLPHPSLYLHTLPMIRTIVAADDLLEEEERLALERSEERLNRKTGRPMRAGAMHQRWWEYMELGSLQGARRIKALDLTW
ncbi:hypothetical protein IAT38_004345 [Cryptococcus sp. DSM 104549]